jgi:hypothetical protein
MYKMFFAVLFLCCVIVSCGVGKQAGTTSETENDIRFYVQMPDGKPAAHARIFIVKPQALDAISYENTILGDTVFTDSNGFASIPVGDDYEDNMYLIQWNEYAYFSRLQQDSVLVYLEKAGSIRGSTKPNSYVTIYPIGLQAYAGDSGEFTFTNVPQGSFALWGQAQNAKLGLELISTVQVSAEQESQVQIVSGFLLEDFDDGDEYPAIYSVGMGNAWYVYTEMAATQVEPAQMHTDFSLALVQEDAWFGKSLQTQFTLDTNRSISAFASIACKIGMQYGSGRANLSAMDSVSFMIKGQGQVRVFFASDFIHTQYPDTEASSDLGYTFGLNSEWTRVVIPIDSLLPPAGSLPAIEGVTWNDVKHAIDLFGLGSWDEPGAVIQIQLDDIRLHGVTIQDLAE